MSGGDSVSSGVPAKVEKYKSVLFFVGVLCVLIILLLATGILGDGLCVKVVAAKSGMSSTPPMAVGSYAGQEYGNVPSQPGWHDPKGRSGFAGRRSSGFGGYEPPVFWNPGDLAVIGADQDAGIRAEEAGAVAYGSAEHGVLARRKTAADWAVQGLQADRNAYRLTDPIVSPAYLSGMASDPVFTRDTSVYPSLQGHAVNRVSGMEDNFGARLSPY